MMNVSTINGGQMTVRCIGKRCNSELEAYRSTGYTPEQIYELEAAYWICNMQIALYDDENCRLKRELGYY